TLAHLAVELVAQDGEQPGLDIGAELEAFLLRPCFHDGILHQIVGLVVAARQRERERPETGQRCQQVALERRGLGRPGARRLRRRGYRLIPGWHWLSPVVPPGRAFRGAPGTCRGWFHPAQPRKGLAASCRYRSLDPSLRPDGGHARRLHIAFRI